jgi:hypothetical protein
LYHGDDRAVNLLARVPWPARRGSGHSLLDAFYARQRRLAAYLEKMGGSAGIHSAAS